jgi:hypothetical protein
MHNFGRGMWRRVGDFERIHKPMLIQQSRLEQWQQFIQQQAYKQQYNTNILTQKQVQEPDSEPRPETEIELEPVPEDNLVQLDLSIENKSISMEENKSISLEENKSISMEENKSISLEENKSISMEENNITQELDIINTPDELQHKNSEPPVVIPKKAKRKNKKL